MVIVVTLVVPGQVGAAVPEGGPGPVDLGTLGGATSEASAINDDGWVVGQSRIGADVQHAFLWRRGRMVDLGAPGPEGASSFATDVNNRGEVVGHATTAGGGMQAFVWRRGEMVALAADEGDITYATGTNDRGDIAGWRLRGDGGGAEAVVWRDGVIRGLSVPGGATASYAEGVNDRGMVVGTVCSPCRAVVWRGGVIFELDRPTGMSGAFGHGINERGQVAGVALTEDGRGSAAVRWGRGGAEVLAGGLSATAYDIDDRGTAVGLSYAPPGPTRAVVWRGREARVLPSRVPGGESYAAGINERGQIVGASATVAPHGESHAVLWPSR